MSMIANAMAQGCTADEYENVFWPQLRGALDTVLLKPPGTYHPISYEQVKGGRLDNVISNSKHAVFVDVQCCV